MICHLFLSNIWTQFFLFNRDYTRNSEQVTTTTGSAQVDAAETDAQYQHLKRDTVFAPGTAVPHYDQLKNPEDPNYEMAITSSETIGD